MKHELFKRELNYIKNKKYVDNLKIMIDLLPDYFFKVPASSTGKYHPEFSLGDKGLLRHSKFAAKIAYEMYNDDAITSIFNQDEKDLMIFALLIHDGLKLGHEEEKYTRFDHPLLAAQYVRDNKENLSMNDEDIEFIASVIETHMGPWITDYNGVDVLEPPKTKYQNFVHMCDYIASRKFLNVSFDDKENIIG